MIASVKSLQLQVFGLQVFVICDLQNNIPIQCPLQDLGHQLVFMKHSSAMF